MPFLLPGRSTCFICEQSIATRVEAAQLQYASPEEVGNLAHHSRSWVHRACWMTWSQRAAWSFSTARLIASVPETLSTRSVMAMPTHDGILVTDASAAFAVTVPRDAIAELRSAFAAKHSTTVMFDHVFWTLTPLGTGIQLTAIRESETVVDLLIEDSDAWCQVLRQASAS